jgi:DNA-binding NtrC family response regulator
MGKARILIIDDEPSIAEALTLILDDQGYETMLARCGRDGVAEAERLRFDITVTDLRLPDITGLDVLNALRAKDADARVIVMTAHGTPEVVCELKACGAIEVLKKPFLPSEILALIESALKDRRVSPEILTVSDR